MFKNIYIIIIFCFLASDLFAQTIPQYVPTNGLVAWYPFNGNANDESGNGNNGILNGTLLTTDDRNGNANSAYSFTGATGYISGSCAAFPTAERTVSLWFYGTNIGAGIKGKAIFGYGGSICGTSWLEMFDLPAHPGTYEESGHCDANLVTYNYGSIAPNNTWHNWIITNNSSGIKFYIDGQLVVSSTTYSNNTYVTGKEFVIGGIPSANGTGFSIDVNQEPFLGKIDDIAIYNRTLTECEIHQLYSGYVINFTLQPFNVNAEIGNSVQFIVSSMDTTATYQWQTDSAATGFRDISGGGQYAGTSNDTLAVNSITPDNDGQKFRCIVFSPGFCTDTSLVAAITIKTVYTFAGTGNWDINTNWLNNAVPPAVLPANSEILINPAGTSECILNVMQTISPGAKITVMPGKKFRVIAILQ